MRLLSHNSWRLYGSTLPRLCVLGVIGACGCGRRSDSGITQSAGALAVAARALPVCGATHLDTSQWVEVSARETGFSVRVPHFEGEVSGTAQEIWRTGSGTVAYSLHSLWRGWIDSLPALRLRGYCADTVVGHPVVMYYASGHSVSGPGHGLQAFWQVGPQRELELIISWQTGTARDTLFAIARSVRFH